MVTGSDSQVIRFREPSAPAAASNAAASFLREARAGVVDQDVPHHPRGEGEEMGPVLPDDLPAVEEAQEELVDEGGRLEGVRRPLSPELGCREGAELPVDEGNELLERPILSGPPLLQNGGHVIRLRRQEGSFGRF